MKLLRWIKLWMAGRTWASACWMGLHPWDMPGGHCEKCGKCDEFFGSHKHCRSNK